MRLTVMLLLGAAVLLGLGCGEDAPPDSSAGVADDSKLAEARAAVASAEQAVKEAEGVLAGLADAVAEHARLSEQLASGEAQAQAYRQTLNELDQKYEKKNLVMPRAARRRFLEARSGLESLRKSLPGLREQVAQLEPQVQAHALAVAAHEAAREAHHQATAGLAQLEGPTGGRGITTD